MQILIAQHSGFCEGVDRAYSIALKAAKEEKNLYMLGNLVHNAQVVEKLKTLGIKNVHNLSEIPDFSTLLISAHGVPPEIYTEAEKKNLKIIDTTCSWVKRAQKLAKELAKENFQVIIAGDKGHPEVEGLVGWAQGKAIVIEKPSNLNNLKLDRKIGIIAQTTQSQENFDQITKELATRDPRLVTHNTICGATSKRQSAAVEVARKVDLMLVIGDKKSANTKRLYELCSQTGTKTYWIQTAEELDNGWIDKNSKIGITAGASTPDWIVAEVKRKLTN